MSPHSKLMILKLANLAHRHRTAFAIKFLQMALADYTADQWILYLENEFLGLVTYSRPLRSFTLRTIDVIRRER